MFIHAYKPILYIMGVGTAIKCVIYYYISNNVIYN